MYIFNSPLLFGHDIFGVFVNLRCMINLRIIKITPREFKAIYLLLRCSALEHPFDKARGSSHSKTKPLFEATWGAVQFRSGISKHRVSRRTPYLFSYAAPESNRCECTHSCCWGWFWVLMRALACLDPSLQYESDPSRNPDFVSHLATRAFKLRVVGDTGLKTSG